MVVGAERERRRGKREGEKERFSEILPSSSPLAPQKEGGGGGGEKKKGEKLSITGLLLCKKKKGKKRGERFPY